MKWIQMEIILFVCVAFISAANVLRVNNMEDTDDTNIIDFEDSPASCKCENGKCVIENGQAVCKCNPEYGAVSKIRCIACDCGIGANCTFEFGFFSNDKYCLCPDGTELRNERCEDEMTSLEPDITHSPNTSLSDGNWTTRWDFNETNRDYNWTNIKDFNDTIITWDFNETTTTGEFNETTTRWDFNETTRDCKCENGKCVIENGETVCKCNPEYGAVSKIRCIDCDCGTGANCTFEFGFFFNDKYCLCPDGTELRNERCEDQTTDYNWTNIRDFNDTIITWDFNETNRDYNWTNIRDFNDTIITWDFNETTTTGEFNETTTRRDFNETTRVTCTRDSDCLNGGICETVRNENFCRCQPNFGGQWCQVNLCHSLDPICRAMRGVCKIYGGNAICDCPPETIYHQESGICTERICNSLRSCVKNVSNKIFRRDFVILNTKTFD
ncbi:neurogenic locus notch 1 [Caerostris extrusa]|uniref:Neurogenic locus notch 1 n=1 Tax=Caerostris extrusa TaxID=172846 RepID=A0AAV4VFG9_CAEEX|nr:neurogenic locus notch 1 [Caerostris extrusa]